ncbi:MAG: 16S rRNA (guanine(527)-N(7))-methyltransferase RsmG [Muribaculaceae bacterium]|nr:16S rRNA (guanine(527)-N(7))-methyltransferase RsmG [Muribaculaceae bacterium]
MNRILKYFPSLTDTQRSQFETIIRLYPEWNSRINVISRKDIDNLVVKHILHSLAIAKFITFTEESEMMDLGTGGGFPGIPLAILFPDCKFHLIDRVGKKLRVAQEIAGEAELTNVTFQHGDVGECHRQFDFVLSRGVMPLPDMVKLVRRNISRKCRNAYPNGLICLKGGDLTAELHAVKYPTLVDEISTWMDEEFFKTKRIVYVDVVG